MKYSLAILFFFLAINSPGQFDKTKISKETEKIVAKIEKINELMGAAVGESGIQPDQYDHFIELQKTATKDELVELINHPNGVVRCYSFWALSDHKKTNLLPIVIKHIYDNEFVETQFGCIGGRMRVGDFFIDVVTPKSVDSTTQKLTGGEVEQLDSFLIYTSNQLWARRTAINRAELTDQLYTRLRQLVIKEKYLEALPVLALFEKEQDIELILNSKERERGEQDSYHYTYLAIQNFPRAEFIALLEKNLKNALDDDHVTSEWRNLYYAIAMFKDQKAVELLTIPLTGIVNSDIKEYHLDFIYDAVLEYYDKIYDDILWKLFESGQDIEIDGFRFYLKSNPSKTYAFTIRELTDASVTLDQNFEPVYDESVFTEELQETMLNLVLRNDRDLAYQIIEHQLGSSDGYSFELYSAVAGRLKEQRFIKPLMKRFESEWNAHVYLRIAEALIAYNDESINKQIVSARRINVNLNKDWGAKELDELLRKNNIK